MQRERDQHLDHLPDDLDLEAFEWETAPGIVTLACGCRVAVQYGDTLWGFEPDDGGPVFFAVERPVLH